MTTVTNYRVAMRALTKHETVLRLPDTVLPRFKHDLDINDTTYLAVSCFIKNFIG